MRRGAILANKDGHGGSVKSAGCMVFLRDSFYRDIDVTAAFENSGSGTMRFCGLSSGVRAMNTIYNIIDRKLMYNETDS